MRVRSIQVLSAALALVAIVACGGRRPMPALTYYEFKPVDPHAWRLTDTLRFRPDTATLAPAAELSMSLRLGQQFAYRDLWLVCEQRSDSLQRPHRDTVHFIVANARGRWHTTGVVLHEAEKPVRTVNIQEQESPEFLVYHIMNEQEIKGVYDVGLRLEPSASKGNE